MSRPANLNQTEAAAWEWLVNEEGYDPGDIKRESADQSPDFICPDESYEAKRPNGMKFVVSERQRERFDTLDPTIVIIHEDDDSPKATFSWSERDSVSWSAHTYDQSQLRMQVPKETKREFRSLLARINEDDAKAIGKLVEYFERDRGRIDELQRMDRKTTFRGPG